MSLYIIGTSLAKFWAKVNRGNKNECWNWTGSKSLVRHGCQYGRFYVPGDIAYAAHRVSWNIHFGFIPHNKLICHSCDNGLCVNPNHLFLGSNLENILDCIKKNRNNSEKGEDRYNAKLTVKEVLEIRSKYKPDIVTYKDLAKEYNVTKTAIFQIVKRIKWKHI